MSRPAPLDPPPGGPPTTSGPASRAAEEALIEQALVQGGKARAVEALMSLHGEAIYAFCVRNLLDPTSAEDVHQEVFVEAWRDLDRFAHQSSWRTWLFSIAAHNCCDARRWRVRWRRYFTSLGARAVQAPDPAPGAEQSLSRLCEQTGVESWLATLDPTTRMAILLRFNEGFSYEYMAQAIFPESTAAALQKRVHRAFASARDDAHVRSEVHP